MSPRLINWLIWLDTVFDSERPFITFPPNKVLMLKRCKCPNPVITSLGKVTLKSVYNGANTQLNNNTEIETEAAMVYQLAKEKQFWQM